MLNRYADLLLVLALTLAGLAGCANRGDSSSGNWDGRDPFSAAAQKAPVTDEFRQRFGLGLTMLMQSSPEESLAHWQGMTADYPQYPGVWVNYGLAQAANHEFELAMFAYKEALSINPAFCDALSLKGVAERELGLFTEAGASYQSAIQCDPGQGRYYYNLGILNDLYRNDLEAALTAYRKARRLLPDDETLDIWVTDLARRAGQPEEDPAAIDDWYFRLTGNRPVVTQPVASPDGDAAEPEAATAEQSPETQPAQQPVEYNQRINPFLPDDSAMQDTEESGR